MKTTNLKTIRVELDLRDIKQAILDVYGPEAWEKATNVSVEMGEYDWSATITYTVENDE